MSVIAGWTAPFNTIWIQPVALRMLFWASICFGTIFVVQGIRLVIVRIVPDWMRYQVDILSMFLMTFIAAPAIYFGLRFGGAPEALRPDLLVLWLDIFVVCVAIALIRTVVLRQRWQPVPVVTIAANVAHEFTAPVKVQMLERLEGVDDATKIIRLSSDNHYVVVTIVGQEQQRVLMRLSDAVKEMTGINGIQVHRSHWVARAAIERIGREDARDYVWLTDGSQVPVSKSGKESLREAGIIFDAQPSTAQQDIAAQ